MPNLLCAPKLSPKYILDLTHRIFIEIMFNFSLIRLKYVLFLLGF